MPYIYQTQITKSDPSWVGHNLLGFSNPVVVSPPVPTAPMVLVWEPELPRVLPRRMPARVSFTCSTETLSNCTPYTLTNEWVLGQNWLANGPPPYYSNVPIRFYESIHSPRRLIGTSSLFSAQLGGHRAISQFLMRLLRISRSEDRDSEHCGAISLDWKEFPPQ